MNSTKGSANDQKARAELLKCWHRQVRHQSPATRLSWMESALGLVAMGARQRKAIVAELRALRKRLELHCCSESWIDARWHGGDNYRGRGMVMSTHSVRYGEGKPHRRATPAPAAPLEDHLDGLTYGQAATYDALPSSSAVGIRMIGLMRGREISDEEMRRRRARGQKLAATRAARAMTAAEIVDSVHDAAQAEAVDAIEQSTDTGEPPIKRRRRSMFRPAQTMSAPKKKPIPRNDAGEPQA